MKEQNKREKYIVARYDLAKRIGLVEAIVLQQLSIKIEKNRKEHTNFYDGKYWACKSIEEWHKKYFNCLSLSTVKRVFKKLEDENYLIAENHNEDKRDRTKWYTVNEKTLDKTGEN